MRKKMKGERNVNIANEHIIGTSQVTIADDIDSEDEDDAQFYDSYYHKEELDPK